MKIKQVRELTDLSERTIRYYESELLISPVSKSMNNRNFREYSQADVDDLLVCAGLRRALFSIQEIREMMQNPDRIPLILGNYKSRTHTELEVKTRVLQAIDHLQGDQIKDIGALSTYLKPDIENFDLPQIDIKPNFGRFDNISTEEREREFQTFLKHEARRERIIGFFKSITSKGWYAICTILVVLLVVSIFINLSTTAQIEAYNQLGVKQTYVRWNEIELMAERVENYFQNSDGVNVEYLRTYVSDVCSYFPMSDFDTRFDSDIYQFFTFCYSTMFQTIISDGKNPNLEAFKKSFRAINAELLQISQSIIASQEDGVQKLLNPKSPEYKVMKEKILIFANKSKSEFNDLVFGSS